VDACGGTAAVGAAVAEASREPYTPEPYDTGTCCTGPPGTLLSAGAVGTGSVGGAALGPDWRGANIGGGASGPPRWCADPFWCGAPLMASEVCRAIGICPRAARARSNVARTLGSICTAGSMRGGGSGLPQCSQRNAVASVACSQDGQIRCSMATPGQRQPAPSGPHTVAHPHQPDHWTFGR
jgi:hypothetical protein